MMTFEQRIQASAELNFKHHEAERNTWCNGIEVLTWAPPKGGFSSVQYMIMRNKLIVTGSCGCAIYMWTDPISFEFLEECDVGYFSSKTVASPYGRLGRQWYWDYAEARLQEWVDEAKNEDDDGEEHQRRLKAIFGEKGGYTEYPAIRAIDTQYEWSRWLEENGRETFGADWIEWGNIGDGICTETWHHWLGLKAAMKWLKENS